MTKRLNEMLFASCLALASFAGYGDTRASEYHLRSPRSPISPLHPASPVSPMHPKIRNDNDKSHEGPSAKDALIGLGAVLFAIGVGVAISEVGSAYHKYRFRRENEKRYGEKK